MKFKSQANPGPSEGLEIKSVKQVVPSQAMPLSEILERFTRNEALPIGHAVQYDESEEDISKLSHMDLVDKAEYVDKLNQTKKKYEAQEKEKSERIRARIEEETREKIERETRAKMAGEQSGSDNNAGTGAGKST